MVTKLSRALFGVIASLAAAGSVSAATSVFDNQAAFDAEFTQSGGTIDFNALTGFLQPNPLVLGGVSFASSNNSGLYNSTGFGLPGNYLASQNGGFIEIGFGSGVSAVSFEYATLHSASTATFTLYSSSGTLGTYTRTTSGDVFAFIGFSSDSDLITGIDFALDGNQFEAVENLRVGTAAAPVPLPATGMLLLAGLGGIAALRRRSA